MRRFHRRFPELVANVRRNRQRLVTPFDLHKTLQHLLHLQTNSTHAWTNNGFPDGQTAYSLMTDELPADRKCAEAGIADVFCSCDLIELKDVDVSTPEALEMGWEVVSHMNRYLEPVANYCAPFTLDRVVTLKRHRRKESYAIQITSKPVGFFEGWLEFHRRGGANVTLTIMKDQISRIDKYKGQSDCILPKHKSLDKFCYCKENFPMGNGLVSIVLSCILILTFLVIFMRWYRYNQSVKVTRRLVLECT